LCSQHFYLAHFLRDPAHRAVMEACPVCNLLQGIFDDRLQINVAKQNLTTNFPA